jgi:hypothetical protein
MRCAICDPENTNTDVKSPLKSRIVMHSLGVETAGRKEFIHGGTLCRIYRTSKTDADSKQDGGEIQLQDLYR